MGQAGQVIRIFIAAVLCRDAFGNGLIHCRFHRIDAVTDQRIDQPACITDFAAGHAPDKRAIAGIVLFDSGFLLDNLRAVETQTRLAGDNQIAAQGGGDRHPAETADGARDNADHRGVAPQVHNRRMNVGNRREAEVGLLQAHAAGFEAQNRQRRDAVAVVFGRQFQCRRHFRAGDFTHATALEGTFDGNDHRRLAVDGAASDHHAVVGLRYHALRREPRRHHAGERIDQFAVAPLIKQRPGTFTGA